MPFTPATDRPRQAPPSRLLPRLLSIVSVSALVMAPLAALSLWLLLTDPVTAAAVMERGDVFPVLKEIIAVLGKAMAAVLSMM